MGSRWRGEGSLLASFSPPDPGGLLPLEAAIANPALEPLDPAELAAPEELLEALREADRLLLLVHEAPPPDADAMGGALGLSRALRHLGKRVQIGVDEPLPGFLRHLARPGEIRRASAAAGEAYDAVVLLDVNERARLGPGAWVPIAAPRVLVVDHHTARAAEALGQDWPGQRVLSWQDPQSEAASLQAAILAARLLAEAEPPRDEAWAELALPLLVGILADSGGFEHPGVRLPTLRAFKFLLEERLRGNVAAVREALRWELPPTAAALLEDPPRVLPRLLAPDAGACRSAFADCLRRGERVRTEVRRARLGICWIPERFVEAVTCAGRLEDPELNRNDIGRQIGRIYAAPLARRHPFSVTLSERTTEGRTRVHCAIRSWEAGPALRLADRLGGGGHPRAAGATVEGSFEAVLERIERWFEDERAPVPASGG